MADVLRKHPIGRGFQASVAACALACVCALTLVIGLLLSLTGLHRNVYYLLDDLSAGSRGATTVRNAGPSRPAHSILLTSPPNPMAPEPLSTPPLDLRLMDRWLATKMIEILVTARKERDESYTVNESLLVESDSPERSKEILR